jgi:hypothetical protein
MPEEAPVTRAVPWVWGEFMTVLLIEEARRED